MIFGQRTFFSIIKPVIREKREFHLVYYNAVFKDRVLFRQTQPSIEIDVIVVKKICLLKFRRKVCEIKVTKRKFMLL